MKPLPYMTTLQKCDNSDHNDSRQVTSPQANVPGSRFSLLMHQLLHNDLRLEHFRLSRWHVAHLATMLQSGHTSVGWSIWDSLLPLLLRLSLTKAGLDGPDHDLPGTPHPVAFWLALHH